MAPSWNCHCQGIGREMSGSPGDACLIRCDSVSYPCGNGKVSALKVLLGSAMPGLNSVLGEPATHSGLKHADRVLPHCMR